MLVESRVRSIGPAFQYKQAWASIVKSQNAWMATAVVTTSILSAGITLALTSPPVAQPDPLSMQAATDSVRLLRQLNALQQQLDAERRKSERLRLAVARLKRETEPARGLAASVRDTDTGDRPTGGDFDAGTRLQDPEPTPWEQLRSYGATSATVDAGVETEEDRIAKVSDILALADDQEGYYQQLVADYGERVDALYDRVVEQYDLAAGQDPFSFQDMLLEIEREKSELDAMLDEDFARALSEQQRARYLALPSEERGIGPNAGLDRLELNLFDLPFILFSQTR
jgi:polyhydroxyalkanoate synthesis regulator phasin